MRDMGGNTLSMEGNASQSPAATSLCSGLLLAGGESRRMGSDKAGLVLGGEALWRRQLRTLRAAGVGEILISRGALPALEVKEHGVVQIPDVAESAGPLGGLLAGLRATS